MTTQARFVNSRYLRDFFKHFLPNSQAVALAIILVVSFVLIYTLSDLLMPVFVSIVLAYLLEGLVGKAESMKMPRQLAVYLVFSAFMACLIFLLFYLMPLVGQQAVELIQDIPAILNGIKSGIMRLPEMYPHMISASKIHQIIFAFQQELLSYGQKMLSNSGTSVMGLVGSVMGLVSVMIYLFLVPMMVFFFLKDKQLLVAWFLQFMPRDRSLSVRVWEEVDMQIGNYVRGKFSEVFILWAISYITYVAMGLNYAMLLAVLMGLQVIIPYIGATLVTFPVLGVAYFQWGLGSDEFMYVVIAYSVIQALDGVVLVPVLFSEAVNLHAVAIIIAILFFGGLWGFWGVFLAIPLATVVKAVLTAWPRIGDKSLNTAIKIGE
ncbi:MAG: AI-2E family transporter [Methylobacter sp.]|nr:AI-2E family transporter [Methylobacter sp.]MDP2100249.1 AI-2E family transporter [Methylobacter sp.]MDP2426855.1 AI-2E family transporter [Methylobacter sp.]MDP3053573.1 AI-2E family transporter [Methylobacter sp.]MDP3360857.1 AI-2E family transporter [Methylobacter sp.]